MKKHSRKEVGGAERGEYLDTILDCIAEGVFTVDCNKRITFFNRAAERITGYSASEAIGQYCHDIFKTTRCGSDCTLDSVWKKGRQIISEPVKILDRDGRSLVVSVSAAGLLDADGNVIGGVETFRDLTAEEQLRREVSKAYTFHDIVSRHPGMHELFAIMPDVAESNVSVLIEGESGTGKELFARAIHNLGPRKDKPFIAVNCGALPDTLLESELFGYRKGAFTDAKSDKPGRFDLVKDGTLFLDEIGDISPALQVRLLRVLQEKTYEPLGGTVPQKSMARIVAATNQKLLAKVRDGSFREDLYYRLNVLRLELPPLRDRRCDIPLLVDHFRRRLNAETGKNIEAVDDAVLSVFMRYEFPGNIRELENFLQHAFVLCREAVVKLEHLPSEFARIAGGDRDSGPLSLDEIERSAILNALQDHSGNRMVTARQLGINPSTLYRKMKRYRIN